MSEIGEQSEERFRQYLARLYFADGQEVARILEEFGTGTAGHDAVEDYFREAEALHLTALIAFLLGLASWALSRELAAIGVRRGTTNLLANGLAAPGLTSLMEDYLQTTARLFLGRYSQTSLERTFSTIADWKSAGSEDFRKLTEMLRPVWEGPRVGLAARQESQRFLSEARFRAWNAEEVWGYGIVTAGDENVRPHHNQRMLDGPYPLADRRGKVPIDDNYGCRCENYPVFENPFSEV